MMDKMFLKMKVPLKGVSLGLKDYLDKNRLEIIVVAIDLNPEGEERINEYCPWVSGAIAEKIYWTSKLLRR